MNGYQKLRGQCDVYENFVRLLHEYASKCPHDDVAKELYKMLFQVTYDLQAFK